MAHVRARGAQGTCPYGTCGSAPRTPSRRGAASCRSLCERTCPGAREQRACSARTRAAGRAPWVAAAWDRAARTPRPPPHPPPPCAPRQRCMRSACAAPPDGGRSAPTCRTGPCRWRHPPRSGARARRWSPTDRAPRAPAIRQRSGGAHGIRSPRSASSQRSRSACGWRGRSPKRTRGRWIAA